MANSKRRMVEVASTKSAINKSPRKVTATLSEFPQELVACRAHEKWQQRGCPLWENEQDWFAARAELEHERAIPGQPVGTDHRV